MRQHRDDVSYQQRAGANLNETATASLRKNDRHKGEVDYEVDCPTCHGVVLVTEFPGGTFRAVPATDIHADVQVDVDAALPSPAELAPVPIVYMACGCGRHHPGAPEGITGCGSLWVVPA